MEAPVGVQALATALPFAPKGPQHISPGQSEAASAASAALGRLYKHEAPASVCLETHLLALRACMPARCDQEMRHSVARRGGPNGNRQTIRWGLTNQSIRRLGPPLRGFWLTGCSLPRVARRSLSLTWPTHLRWVPAWADLGTPLRGFFPACARSCNFSSLVFQKVQLHVVKIGLLEFTLRWSSRFSVRPKTRESVNSNTPL